MNLRKYLVSLFRDTTMDDTELQEVEKSGEKIGDQLFESWHRGFTRRLDSRLRQSQQKFLGHDENVIEAEYELSGSPPANAAIAEMPEEEDDFEDLVAEDYDAAEDYNGWTVTQLRAECRKRKLAGTQKLNKDGLIGALTQHDQESVNAHG